MVELSVVLVILTIPVYILCLYLLYDVLTSVVQIQVEMDGEVELRSELYAQAASQIIRLQRLIQFQEDKRIDSSYSESESTSTSSD